MSEIDRIQMPVKSYSEHRLDEMSRRLQRSTSKPDLKESPRERLSPEKSPQEKSSDTERVSPGAKPLFTDEVRKFFPGIDEGRMPSSAFKLEKMPDPSTLTGERKRLYDTAVEFQSLFINMMLKGMRSTLKPENDMLHGGKTQEIFEDMLYDERAKSFSKHGGFPLAEQIYLQMAPMIQEQEATDSYENNLKRVPPTVSTDQIQREWKR